MSEITLTNAGTELKASLPDFYEFSSTFRAYLADPEYYSFYEVCIDYARRLADLFNENDQEKLPSYFAFVNRMVESKDEYVGHCLYECLIEFFALSTEAYYKQALTYLSPGGIQLVEGCKAHPPLGVKSPPW